MNGANSDGQNYEPDTTSYDYDAPVSEGGELTPKYSLFRDVIRQATGQTPPDPPAPIPARAFAPVQLSRSASLWQNLPKPIESNDILSMEDVGQNYGYILYRTTIPHAQSGELRIDGLHSYARVSIDGQLAGTLDRRLNQSTLPLQIPHDGARLDILVENTGRVNFGHKLPGERAGITRQVTLANAPLAGWQIYPLPMQNVDSLSYTSDPCSGPCFYQASLQIDEPADTYLDTRSLGKGEVFVNGEPLGRFWNEGPQGTLYLPAPWLRKGANEIVVFDLEGRPDRTVDFLAQPVLDWKK